MLKVLLVAPTVDGTDVGESWVAFQWAKHLQDQCDLTLLTYRKRDRPSVTSQLPGLRVVEWTEPPLLGRSERFNSLLKPGYLPFYLRVRHWVRRAVARGEQFDVAHQPVPVGLRYPTALAGLGIPYVVGPLGGGLQSPPGFEEQDTAPWYVALRRTDAWRLDHDPILRRGLSEASCVLGIAPYAAEAMQGIPLRRFLTMPETALESLPVADEPRSRSEGPVRLLFVGRLVRTKGARDAIAALAHLADLEVVLEVVGDGFDRAACEQTAHDLGVSDRVCFRGALARSEVEASYRAADIFVFPSFREPGGNVAFEAMGHRLPLVVSDRGGPANVVNDACGIKVPVRSPAQYAVDLAHAVRRLVEDPELRASMGQAARARVEEIGLWDKKIEAILKIYQDVRDET